MGNPYEDAREREVNKPENQEVLTARLRRAMDAVKDAEIDDAWKTKEAAGRAKEGK